MFSSILLLAWPIIYLTPWLNNFGDPNAAPKRQPGACTCGGADERTLWRLRRLGGLSAAAVGLAEILGRKAQAEAMAEADRLDADLRALPDPGPAPAAEPAAALEAPPDRIEAPGAAAPPDPAPPDPAPRDPAPPPEPEPGARPPAWNAPRRIGWTVLFMRVSREARRIDALEAAVEKARAAKARAACPEAAAEIADGPPARSEPPGQPSRPDVADPPAADDPRLARIRVLALEAARADPEDRDLQDLAQQIDMLLDDGVARAGLDAGDAVADLAADICADLGIGFDFRGMRQEDLDPSDPDDPVWRRDPAPD